MTKDKQSCTSDSGLDSFGLPGLGMGILVSYFVLFGAILVVSKEVEGSFCP